MKTSARQPKVFTAADARAAILAKVAKAGAKGAASLFTASAPEGKQAAFREALAALEVEQAIFVDRRKAKPKYFAWAERPALPTVEAVAARLEQAAREQFPYVASRAGWKALLKGQREETALLEEAVTALVESGRLVKLLFSKGAKTEELFVPGALLPSPKTALALEEVRAAYRLLAERTGFPSVSISALQQESAAPLPALQEWLLGEQRAGRAILSRGDWSLADEVKRAAAVEWEGQTYLLARLLA